MNAFSRKLTTSFEMRTPTDSRAGSFAIWIILILLIILGGGGYYVFGSKFENMDGSFDLLKGGVNNTRLSCADILPESKVREITGIAQVATAEEDRSRAVEGLNQLPGQPGTGDLVVSSGIEQLICGYAFNKTAEEAFKYGGAIGGDFKVIITWNDSDKEAAKRGYETVKKVKTDIATGGGSFAGMSVSPDPTLIPADVPGVGAAAYADREGLDFLSSNQKYTVSITGDRNSPVTSAMRIELAKVIDSNL
jgi:hypothetical protein